MTIGHQDGDPYLLALDPREAYLADTPSALRTSAEGPALPERDAMTDEAPETPDTPTPSDTHEIPWQKRYEDLRPEFDRATQQLSRFEKDPTALIEFIQEKHPDLLAEEDQEPETFEDDDVFEDPRDQQIAQLEQRLQRLEPWQQDVENERGERRFNNDLKEAIGDREVTERQKTWIKARTFELGNNPEALKKAVEDFTELEKELTSAHLDQVTRSKKAPHVSAGGQAGTQVPNLDNQQERHDWLRQRVRELESKR